MKHLQAVIFDWAGTTVDFGCLAPSAVFEQAFEQAGLTVSPAAVRQFMGLPKLDHTRKIFELPDIAAQFRALHGRPPEEADVQRVYEVIEPEMERLAPHYAELIPGTAKLARKLRTAGLKIGSTTGYTRAMMQQIMPVAAAHGYAPDAVVTPGEVGCGRPSPKMIEENLRRLNLAAADRFCCVKIGDTVADITEGRNAGCWTIGFSHCGNEMGLSESDLAALPPDRLKARTEAIHARLLAAGADYIVPGPDEAFDAICEIDWRIGLGARPGQVTGMIWNELNGNPAIPANHYLLLTPGPLSTSPGVRAAAARDWCTWDADYNQLVQEIRAALLHIAGVAAPDYSAVLMQGSGTFGVESVIGSAVPDGGHLLVCSNGHYGTRIAQMAAALKIPHTHLAFSETSPLDPAAIGQALDQNPKISHVALVHCETTTGLLNPLQQLAPTVKSRGKTLIVDAMSSFGGIPLDAGALQIDFLISSANKCLQGIPGFSFIIARTAALQRCRNNARSLALDLYAQYEAMENGGGKWRYTSPTHTVRAFFQALCEFQREGGVDARHQRYRRNQASLVAALREKGLEPLLPGELHSPIITSFRYPNSAFDFQDFYNTMKRSGFVLYPGKISREPTFRIGTIGEIHPPDIERLAAALPAFA